MTEYSTDLGDYLGRGVFWILNQHSQYARERIANNSGPPLTGWCLALNRHDDLVFLHTEGYHLGYIQRNSAPGGVHFDSRGFAVKSRESSAQFMVLGPGENFTAECSRDDMVEWARRWNGYEVTGDEKEYYMALIQAAEEGNGEEV
ncbi:hypothetical protein BP00DRAFT_425815 [Aspergillus indologenus CBS 114.80]|uniref:Uncharacterized protein n=1 Tax=Aspergillus indologenus CBS 114.80 TaxID=1450541 RepID=A0A2V5I390_9EURO|nr:hypothetical protein BP00DRAFT_425815 [Aspergillus indologenus CBS 114.80]